MDPNEVLQVGEFQAFQRKFVGERGLGAISYAQELGDGISW